MNLYHFTAAHLYPIIEKEGITRGKVPMIGVAGRLELLDGYQWLTINPAFWQEWCNPEFSTLPYNRNAVRLTVEIPKLFHKRVLTWLRCPLCRKNRLSADLNAFNDPGSWRLYRGRILPEWITAVDWNPNFKPQTD